MCYDCKTCYGFDECIKLFNLKIGLYSTKHYTHSREQKEMKILKI